MKKQVTFVEQLKKENPGNAHVSMRSAESNRRYTDGFECLHGQQLREAFRGTHMNMSVGGQHMKTVHVPKSMMSAPFLQHPALTAGQRRYLCSIANIYSTEHMRQQMKQHYLNVLHTCIQSGQNPTYRKQRENSLFTKEAEKDVARTKPRGQSKSSTANSDVIFPKIVNK